MQQQSIDVSDLTDEALAEAAWLQRREALHGNCRAYGRAHELERELRRRASLFNTDSAPLTPTGGKAPSPWWRLWGRPSAAVLDAKAQA